MKRSITITIDHLPPTDLNPNNLRSTHWSVRSKATQEAKEEIGWLAKAAGWSADDKPMVKAEISYEFHLASKRARDLDNLLSACKAWQDGLIEVGVLTYDDCHHLSIGRVKALVADKEQTIIMVREIG